MKPRNLSETYVGSNETDCRVVYCDPIACPYGCYIDDPYIIPSPPPPPPRTASGSHPLSPYIVVISTSLASFILLVISYIIIRRCCSRRRQVSENQVAGQDGDFPDENRGPAIDHHIWYINTVGLQPSIINSISVFQYKKGGNLIDGSDCSVCLSEFQEDETLRLLPKCSHAFHTHCIDTWLRSHTNCPLCRARIVTNSNLGTNVQDSADLGQDEGLTLTQMGNSAENGETRRGVEIDDDVVDDVELRDWSFIRRSVSMDFGHSSVPKSLEKINENEEGPSSGSQVIPQRASASVSMNRSFSCSGRVILTRCNRNPNPNLNPILPL